MVEVQRTWLTAVVSIKNWVTCCTNHEGIKDIRELLHLNAELLHQKKHSYTRY